MSKLWTALRAIVITTLALGVVGAILAGAAIVGTVAVIAGVLYVVYLALKTKDQKQSPD